MEKRHKEEEHENDERWLLTYADLITLLMVFFVVMYAISKADSVKFNALSQSMAVAFGAPRSSVLPMPETGVTPYRRLKRGDSDEFSRSAPATDDADRRDTTQMTKHAPQPEARAADEIEPGDKNEKAPEEADSEGPQLAPGETRLEHVAREVASIMQARGLEEMVELVQSDDGRTLTIRLRDSILFGRGGADITASAHEVIDRVGAALLDIGLPLNIAGHTDNIPINNSRFRSNWELSTARSTAVLVYLIDRLGFPPDKLSASGYGEYEPIAPNDTRENRSKNRRVEFILTDEQAGRRRAAAELSEPAKFVTQLREVSRAPLYLAP